MFNNLWSWNSVFLIDVMVHRLLAASLGIFRLPDVFQDRSWLTGVADSKDFLTIVGYYLKCTFCLGALRCYCWSLYYFVGEFWEWSQFRWIVVIQFSFFPILSYDHCFVISPFYRTCSLSWDENTALSSHFSCCAIL